MRRAVLLCFCLLPAGLAEARAPETSLRPKARFETVMSVPAGPATQRLVPRPPDRPETVGVQREVQPRNKLRLFGALRPRQRTPQVEQQARRNEALRRRGAVCGDLDIQGVSVGVVGGPGGCGVSEAVRVSAVSGVGLSTHSVMDCTTAKSLKSWIEKGMKPAVSQTGGGVSQIRVVAHYACRTRNNQAGARLSEHAKGRAIDIAGFTLRDGTKLSVLEDWGSGRDGAILRRMHASACGPFGTVLGPDANRFHRDHFHFDTARYRSGSYCR